MYLQLADNGNEWTPPTLAQESPNELYVFIPAGYRGSKEDLYIREDFFDKVPENEFSQMMFELEPYQNHGLSSKSTRQQRRLERKNRKESKTPNAPRVKGGDKRRASKLERVQARRAGKGEGGGFLDKIIGGATAIFGKGDPAVPESNEKISAQFNYGSPEPEEEEEETFWDKYKVPIIIGGVVIVGGGIALAVSKSKSKN